MSLNIIIIYNKNILSEISQVKFKEDKNIHELCGNLIEIEGLFLRNPRLIIICILKMDIL